MNKRNGLLWRAAACCAAVLLLCGTALPVFAEPEDTPEANPAAVTDPAAQTPDTPAAPDAAETATAAVTEVTKTARTEMIPPDPLEMTESEETAGGGVCIRAFRWTCENTVEIPKQIGGKPVTEIGAEAFKYCYAETVLLPDTVTHIGARAFEGCAYLQSVTIPQACVSIGADAFSGCTMLQTVTLPGTVQEIGAGAFDGTPYLENQTGDAVVLGNGILYRYRGSDTAYTVPEQIRIIGAGAFADAETLEKITIPAGVQQIQQGSFSGCTALAEIEAPDTLTYLAADAFADTAWRNDSKEDYLTLGKMLIAYQGKESVAEVPDGIRIINSGAFAGNNGITTVHLPETVREIREEAFCGCGSLQVAEFGDQLTAIGANAFADCRTLNYLRLGHALETVGDYAFAGCPALTEIYLPDTVKTIGEKAFGYGSDDGTDYRRLKNELMLYSNTGIVREYADAAGIAHQPLPDAENTAPALVVTEPENASPGFGKIHGSRAWIAAAVLGSMLVLSGTVSFAVRRKKQRI